MCFERGANGNGWAGVKRKEEGVGVATNDSSGEASQRSRAS